MNSQSGQTALITGIRGQDGYYLAEYLRGVGMKIVGTSRCPTPETSPAARRSGVDVEVVEWDLINRRRFSDILDRYQPTHIFNLAALSSGADMDRDPERVAEINGLAVIKMLDAILQSGRAVRFCQASSSEVFAGTDISPQSEKTPSAPRSVYGAAKILGDNIVKLYREKYGLFCCSAILFNHESPRRGAGFVTQKIVRAAVQISRGRQEKLLLGNLNTARDWGFAGDYARAMALMLEGSRPIDYVIATGISRTVADFCQMAFAALSLDYRQFVITDPSLFRPSEFVPIVGDASRIRDELGWSPTTSFEKLVAMMIDAELRGHHPSG